jgi:hypothetical protein
MKRLASWLLILPVVAIGQTNEANCITAGRLDDAGRWAPQFKSVRLLDEAGRPLKARSKAELVSVRFAELTEPALLSGCDGDQLLKQGDASPLAKAPVPALKKGRVVIEGVGFPRLQIGGELDELKVQATSDQLVMVSR